MTRQNKGISRESVNRVNYGGSFAQNTGLE